MKRIDEDDCCVQCGELILWGLLCEPCRDRFTEQLALVGGHWRKIEDVKPSNIYL